MPLKGDDDKQVLVLVDQPPTMYRVRIVKGGKITGLTWVNSVRDVHTLNQEIKGDVKMVPWDGK